MRCGDRPGNTIPGTRSRYLQMICAVPRIRLIPVTLDSAGRASTVAAQQRLRGADAIYVSAALDQGAIAVTWDREMLDRGGQVVATMTPQQWQLANPMKPAG